MRCRFCGQNRETRLGCCFDCASLGEDRAAKRTVAQHLAKAWGNAWKGRWEYVRFDLIWAWERLTGTGDYAKGGYFDSQGIDWRRNGPI